MAFQPWGEVLHVVLCIALHPLSSRGCHYSPWYLHADSHPLQCRTGCWLLRKSFSYMTAAHSIQEFGKWCIWKTGQTGAKKRVRLDLLNDVHLLWVRTQTHEENLHRLQLYVYLNWLIYCNYYYYSQNIWQMNKGPLQTV